MRCVQPFDWYKNINLHRTFCGDMRINKRNANNKQCYLGISLCMLKWGKKSKNIYIKPLLKLDFIMYIT